MMKQIAKMTLYTVALLAVSACSVSSGSNNDVYSNYDYTPSETVSGEYSGFPVTDLMYHN